MPSSKWIRPRSKRYAQRLVGQNYRPQVKVLKVKNGIPTVVQVGGLSYQLQHPQQWASGYVPPRYINELLKGHGDYIKTALIKAKIIDA